jgi:ATP-dependent Clp protease ATP-binding subunit ClpB
MTSNLGSSLLTDIVESEDVGRERVLAAVREAFKPEFLNRLDEILVFHRLGRDELARIVDLQVARLAARLADRRLNLELTAAAKAWLADRGYDPAYGARPLRRLIAKAVGDELARRLLGGELSDGDTVLVDAEDDKLTFARREAAKVG